MEGSRGSCVRDVWNMQDLSDSMHAHLRLHFGNEEASDEHASGPSLNHLLTVISSLLLPCFCPAGAQSLPSEQPSSQLAGGLTH